MAMSDLLFLLRGLPYIIPFLFIPYLVLHKIRDKLTFKMAINRRRLLGCTRPKVDQHPPVLIGYFHPYCNAGGGGERVLWTIIQGLQISHPYAIHAIYTGDTEVSKEDMVSNVKTRFNIEIQPETVALIYLHKRKWVEAERYPRFTMLGQSLGSLILGWEAMSQLIPDVFFDTMGYAFTYPIVQGLAQCQVACYVHYPTISTDMLAQVKNRDSSSVHTSNFVAKSSVLSYLKLLYYHLFAFAYGWAGTWANLVLVNSSWTKGHIDQLWSTNATVLFPPCDTEALIELPVDSSRQSQILSVAQFRPEKNHALQLESLAALFEKHPQFKRTWGKNHPPLKLIVLGSVRHTQDQARVDALRSFAKTLNIQDHVQFVINCDHKSLIEFLRTSLIGIHTMSQEHFGIGVVELMAAGLIPVAHNSGGPQMDIVGFSDENYNCNGHLASTASEYADAIASILLEFDGNSKQIQSKMAENQTAAHNRFSSQNFLSRLHLFFDPVLERC